MRNTFITIFGFALLVLVSCVEPQPEEDTPLEHQTEALIHKINEGDLEILEIEGCEYIIYKDFQGSNHGYGYMAHKGNCINPIHQYNTVGNALPDSLKEEDTE